MTSNTKERFLNYLNEANMSLRKAGQRIGCGHGKLSAYKNDKCEQHRINIVDLESQIERFLTREKQRQGALVVPELTLTSTRNVAVACDIAHTGRTISVVCGPAGCGKTTALQNYTSLTAGVYLIEVDQSFTLAILAQAVCRAIGISPEGSTAVLTRRIEAHLSDIDALLIFDECDYLTVRTLEWIRRVIHDKAKCGVVLAGLPKLEYELHSHKNVHDQLLSRVGYIHRAEPPGPRDLGKVIDAVWHVSSSTKKQLVTSCKGSFRTLKNIMSLASLMAQKQKIDIPELEHIEEAIEGVMAKGVTT